MNRDPQMLMSIQIALIGVVIVAGFFYIWRSLSRLESRVEELSCQLVNNACVLQTPVSLSELPSIYKNQMSPPKGNIENDRPTSDDQSDEDEDEDEDGEDDFSLMKACFGNIPIESLMDENSATFMIFNTSAVGEDHEEKEGVILEELSDMTEKHVPGKKTEKPEKIEKATDDISSVAETDSNELSKNKLKKMNVDSLRELCMTRGLATDGVKAILIDRILGSLPVA